MRSLPALLALAAFAAPSLAAPRDGIVKADVAEVRCKNSDKPEFYVTNRLVRGNKVEIVESLEGGWLAIKPPQGSFSSIKQGMLETITPNQRTQVVADKGQEVPVFVGGDVRMAEGARPTVVGVKVKAGHQVSPIGAVVKDPDGDVVRIVPPPSEVRYIKASALEASATFTAAGAAPRRHPAGRCRSPARRRPTRADAGATVGGGIRQEQARNYEEAIRVWTGISEKTASRTRRRRPRRARRAAYLREFLNNRSRSGFVQGQATSTFQRTEEAPRPTAYKGRIVITRGVGAVAIQPGGDQQLRDVPARVLHHGVGPEPGAVREVGGGGGGVGHPRAAGGGHLTVTRITAGGGG